MTHEDLIYKAKQFFLEEESLREELRHALSPILMDTDEEHPMETDIVFDEEKYPSSMEAPRIVKAWQHPTEGWIYFEIEGYPVPVNFDEFSTLNLVEFYNHLYEQQHQ